MDLREIRVQTIIALFSDDLLMQKLVLKGGNALDLVHGVGGRTSLDIDCSMPDDFSDLDDVRRRLSRALTDRFEAKGLHVFDLKLEPKPSTGLSQTWGGYGAEFKLIEKEKLKKYGNDINKMRRDAHIISPDNKRVFSIDISKFEYCETKTEAELEDYIIYAYSLSMIAVEKLRAICQQMPKYTLRAHPRPRARDFYDIHAIVTMRDVDLLTREHVELVKQVFATKSVPLDLLAEVGGHLAFHERDWPSVRNALRDSPKDFQFYFDHVVELASKLHARLKVDGHV